MRGGLTPPVPGPQNMDSETSIHSVTDARRYREELSARQPEQDRAVVKWRIWERFVLFVVAAAAFLIYYLISVNIEILALPSLNSSAVVSAPGTAPASGAEKPAQR